MRFALKVFAASEPFLKGFGAAGCPLSKNLSNLAYALLRARQDRLQKLFY
jgi:hypothetical protein